MINNSYVIALHLMYILFKLKLINREEQREIATTMRPEDWNDGIYKHT